MIDDTLAKIEERIRTSATIKEESRSELIKLLSSLRSEINSLSQTHGEHAENIAGFTQTSTEQATRQDRKPEELEQSLKDLSLSTTELEASHPGLVKVVNDICVALANLGV